MKDYTYLYLIFFIIFFIVIVVFIASASYGSYDSENFNVKSMKEARNLYNSNGYAIQKIKPETELNCYTLRIPISAKNIGYSIVGKFTNSCISVYKDDVRVFSSVHTGYKNIVLGSNQNILSPIFKFNKYKVNVIPLEVDSSYRIVFDNCNELSLSSYKVNYDIELKTLNTNYPVTYGLNEYDLDKYIRSIYSENSLEREYLNNYDKPDEWVFNKEGNFLMLYVKNIYNFDINGIEDVIKVRPSNSNPEIAIREISNPNINIKNFNYTPEYKDINTEYLDFITSPNYLMQKFLYGKKTKDINYSIPMNNKILIYKI